jgi:hypothetical protein
MGHVEDVQALLPVVAGVGPPHEPVGVLGGGGGAGSHEEGRDPDPGAPAARADPRREAGQVPEPGVVGVPVAESGLPAVVDLHDLDRQIEPVHRREVALDVARRHLAPVAVPRAPGRPERLSRRRAEPRAEPLGPARERGLAVRTRFPLHGAVGLHEDAVAHEPRPDRSDLPVRVGGGEDLDGPAVARIDGEEPLALEAGLGSGALGTEGHRLPDGAGGPW